MAEMMKDLIFEELREGMEKALQALERSFSKVRTGRASLALSGWPSPRGTVPSSGPSRKRSSGLIWG